MEPTSESGKNDQKKKKEVNFKLIWGSNKNDGKNYTV